MNLTELTEENMKTRFKANPCRGIVLGVTEDLATIQIAWTMGRSPPSQNRIYVVENDVLRTEAADPSKVDFPHLTIYNAMRYNCWGHIVSNGNQTDSIFENFESARGDREAIDAFVSALQTRHCEPDPPIFTSRISGFTGFAGYRGYMSVLKAEPAAKEGWIATAELAKDEGITRESFRKPGMKESEVSEAYWNEIDKRVELNHKCFPTVRQFFELPLPSGIGYCLTTYAPGNPRELPPFEGEPFPVPIKGTLEETMQMFWGKLEPEWRVSLGGKIIYRADSYEIAKPINRFKKVEVPK